MLVSGRRVLTATGARQRAPQPGPADEMLDRLWGAVGNNGLILIGDESPHWDGLLADAGAWKLAGGPAWFTAARGRTCLRLAVLSKIDPANDPLVGPDELATVSRHQRFADLAGVPFFADGGSTGALLMEETVKVKGGEVLRAWRDDKAPAVREAPWLGPWSVPEYNDPVRLDKNAYYLCAANSAQLPVDGLTHTGGRPDPRDHVGLWRIRTPRNPEPHLPHPMGGRLAAPGAWRWVAHPTMELLADLDVRVEICDSWTCPRPRSRRLLVPWYERLRDARALVMEERADDDTRAVLAAVKDTYSRGIGCLDRTSRRWFRPDWREIIYAQARTALYRTLLKAGRDEGRWPAETRTDMVIYDGTPPGTFRIGTGMGQWKVTR